MSVPRAIVFAGTNGAGKTTFARHWLPMAHPDLVYLNADEIQRTDDAFSSTIAAGREMLRRLAALEQRGHGFALETTLSSRLYARKIPRWIAAGYRVSLHFIELPSADLAVRRVASRVVAGGHEVAEVDIRRRFARGVDFFEKVYQPLVSDWFHWRSDDQGLELHEAHERDSLRDDRLGMLREAARRATWDALHGPPHARAGRFVSRGGRSVE